MRLFVQAGVPPGPGSPAGPGSAELRLREGAGLPGPPLFDEIEWVIEAGFPSFVLYRQRVTRSITTVAACLGNSFDAIVDAVAARDSSVTITWLSQELPSLAALIRSGQLSDLSQAGLMRMADPHHPDVKNWLVATTVGPEPRPGTTTVPPTETDLREAISRVSTMGTVVVQHTLAVAQSSPDLARLTENATDLHELGRRLDGFPAEGLPLGGLGVFMALWSAKWKSAADR